MDDNKNREEQATEILEDATEVIQEQEENKTELAQAEEPETEAAQQEAVALEPKAEEPKAEEPEAASETQAAPATAESSAKKPGQKKLLFIVAVAIVAVALVVGGIVLAKKVHDTKAQYTMEDGSPTPDSPQGIADGHGEKAEVVTGEEATKGAEVKDADAIETVTALSDEQLGLKKKDYSFMVAQQSYIIKGDAYVQVIAAKKKENKDGSVSITPYGKYYISFDGKTILKEDMKNLGNYEEIKQ
ncbi:MAG: hypothetical protein IJJ41_03475 [Clostridia bacterium]|nr:hypothetical protein [Clostridia bacterium]